MENFFVRKDLLYILEQISQSQHYRNIDIQTNGIVFGRNPNLIDDLKKYGVTGIGVSIDGFREEHDSFRGLNGSYDLAVKAARESVEKDMTVTVSTVAYSGNVDGIPLFFEEVKKEIHPRIYRVMIVDPLWRAEENELSLSPKQTREVISFIFNEYVANLVSCSNIPREFGFEGDLRKDRIKDVWEKRYQNIETLIGKRLEIVKAVKDGIIAMEVQCIK